MCVDLNYGRLPLRLSHEHSDICEKLVVVALFYFIFPSRTHYCHARMISAQKVHDDMVSLVTVDLAQGANGW